MTLCDLNEEYVLTFPNGYGRLDLLTDSMTDFNNDVYLQINFDGAMDRVRWQCDDKLPKNWLPC